MSDLFTLFAIAAGTPCEQGDPWQTTLINLHVIADVLIALAYYSIPVTLFYWVRQQQDWSCNRNVVVLFVAFLIACGTTHVAEIWTLWHPAYGVLGFIKAITAVVSIYTAGMMVPLVPQVLARPRPDQLEAMNQELQRETEERDRIEAALRQSEERFRQITENINQVFFVKSAKTGQFLYVSPAYEKIWGRSCESLYQDPQSWLEKVHPDDQALLQKSLANQAQGQPTQKEYRLIQADGSVRWIVAHTSPVRNEAGILLHYVGLAEDITDRKQAEEALRRSEERWHLALQGNKDGIWDHNLITNEHFLSPRCIDMLGYSYDEIATFEKWASHIHPDDVAALQAAFHKHLVHETPSYTFEYRMRAKDGTYKWLLARGQAIWDEQGKPIRAVGSVTDISDRKRIEESLRQYERIVSATTDAIALLDHNYVYQVVNQSYLTCHNKTRDQMIGQSVREVVGETIFETVFQSRLDRCLAGETVQYETGFDFKGIGPQFISVTYAPYFEDNQMISGVVVSIRIITELKRAEEALCQREQEFRTLAENAPDIIMRLDRNFRYLYINPTVERYTGLPPSAFIGTGIQDRGEPDDLNQLWQTTMQKVFSTGEPQAIEFEAPIASGLGYFASRIVPEFAEDGSVKSVLAVARDISDRKQVEQHLQASLREKEILLQEIHHRVKNNLQIVYSLLRLQRRRIYNQQADQILLESQNRVKSIALIHEKLYQSETFSSIDFSQYIPSLASHLFSTYHIRESQISLQTKIDPIVLNIDQAICCGLILNEILSNALKYAFPNRQRNYIEIQCSADAGSCVVLIIRDNGIGLPHMVDFETSASLGLRLIRSLTEQLEGTVCIHRDRGTEFVIHFPLKRSS